MVVVFGLFHGLAFLPVLLSVIGRRPYAPPPLKHKHAESVEHGTPQIKHQANLAFDEPVRLEKFKQNDDIIVISNEANGKLIIASDLNVDLKSSGDPFVMYLIG